MANTTGQGLLSEDSGLFFDAVTIIAKLQAELSAVQQPLKRAGEPQCGRVAFVVENVASMPALARGIMSRMLGVTPIVLRGEDFSDGLIARRRLYWSNLPLATAIDTEFCDGENEGLLSRPPALTPSWSRCRRLRGRLPEDFKYLIVDSTSELQIPILKPVRDNVELDKRPLGTLLREADALGNERHDILLAINEDVDGDQREEQGHVAMSALEVRPCISLPASICLS